MDAWLFSGEGRLGVFSTGAAVEEEEDVSSSSASPAIVDIVNVCAVSLSDVHVPTTGPVVVSDVGTT